MTFKEQGRDVRCLTFAHIKYPDISELISLIFLGKVISLQQLNPTYQYVLFCNILFVLETE